MRRTRKLEFVMLVMLVILGICLGSGAWLALPLALYPCFWLLTTPEEDIQAKLNSMLDACPKAAAVDSNDRIIRRKGFELGRPHAPVKRPPMQKNDRNICFF